MKSVRQNQRLWSVLAALVGALMMLATALTVLRSASVVVAAPVQDDGLGRWTDLFSDTLGLAASLHVTVNLPQTRLELGPSTIVSQTDWSAGSGLISTTATSTNRYAAGKGVNTISSGSVSLGFSLPAAGGMIGFTQDGYPDLVVSNYFTGTDGSGGSLADASYLYHGGPAGFSDANRADLSVTGAVGNAVADLNNDGFLDIVMATARTDEPSYIYWGSGAGYSVSNHTQLPSHSTTCSSIADLDQDGYLDIVLCDFQVTATTIATQSYIYWGSSGSYTITNRTELPTTGAMATFAADFDNDGYLDLGFSNYRNGGDESLTTTYEINSYVYWGSAGGFTVTNRTELPTIGAHRHSAADLNHDGYLDLVFSNRRTGGSTTVTTTYQLNSYVYWGSSSGFTTTNRLELPTAGSYGNSLADLNGDGWPEIIFSNHYNGITHSLSSYIYWNDGGTFTTSSRTELPTIGATGNCVEDLDSDGYPDVFFANRRLGNAHNVPSYIYWGSSGGYTVTQRTSLNTHGAIACSIAGGTIAAGNNAYGSVYAVPITGSTTITDAASTPQIYATSGVITSTAFDRGDTVTWKQVIWTTSIPTGTGIALDTATSGDGTNWSAWSQVAANSLDGTNSASLNITDARFIRYRATLTATADHRQTPVLHDIQLIGGHTSGNATSVAVAPAALDYWEVVTWTSHIEAGQAITVQVLDASSNLIPDSDLSGNSGGFSSSPVDISGLDPSTYPSLRLRTWFSSNSITTTPGLEDWAATWSVAPSTVTVYLPIVVR